MRMIPAVTVPGEWGKNRIVPFFLTVIRESNGRSYTLVQPIVEYIGRITFAQAGTVIDGTGGVVYERYSVNATGVVPAEDDTDVLFFQIPQKLNFVKGSACRYVYSDTKLGGVVSCLWGLGLLG